MSDKLPPLVDVRGIMEECGVKRTFAEQLMRQVPKVQIEGVRKVYARREDILREFDRITRAA